MKKLMTSLTMLVLLLTSCDENYNAQPTQAKKAQKETVEKEQPTCTAEVIEGIGIGAMSTYKVVKLTFKDTIIYQSIVIYDGNTGGAAIANINYSGK